MSRASCLNSTAGFLRCRPGHIHREFSRKPTALHPFRTWGQLGRPLNHAPALSTDHSRAAFISPHCRVPVMYRDAFVNLYTNDIEAGLRFYRDLLGFTETFRTPTEGTPSHVELTLNGFGLGLSAVEAAKRVHGVDATPGSPAMALVMWTSDVDESFRQLTSAGAPGVQPPHPSGKHNRAALLRDPDGNLVEIIARVA